jgi:putative aminopeptidase FrvX
MQEKSAEKVLLELTGLPVAAGCEERVVAWVERWASSRPSVRVRRDRYGNLMLGRTGPKYGRPIIIEAHMDHPAFVVRQARGRTLRAEFRGGVRDAYFPDARVRLHARSGETCPGRITGFRPRTAKRRFPEVTVVLDREAKAAPGDLMTWDLAAPKVRQGRLHAPACDDLAGVAAALGAFEIIGRKRLKRPPDVRLLFTRAEEIGFIGALGACRAGFIPKTARIIALENSKSYPDSPIGAGPVVRVGDRATVFDHRLTYALGGIAEALAKRDKSFRWQRKLMPGGVCEAGAFVELGYTATCLCLPLGNYHNMNEETGAIAPESIALEDYHGLIKLLVAAATKLDAVDAPPSLRSRLNQLFAERADVLERPM